jgi:hypothetical protein
MLRRDITHSNPKSQENDHAFYRFIVTLHAHWRYDSIYSAGRCTQTIRNACLDFSKGDYIVMALPDTTPPTTGSAPTGADNTTPASDSATTSSEVLGYCVKCKARRNMVQVQIVTTQNNRKAAKGKCPVCGTTMNKFLPK